VHLDTTETTRVSHPNCERERERKRKRKRKREREKEREHHIEEKSKQFEL
jgi:hypothetical protein